MLMEDETGTYSEWAGAQSWNWGMTADMAVKWRQRGKSYDPCAVVAMTTSEYFHVYTTG